MHPPQDDVSSLPTFIVRHKTRLQGPRPTSWLAGSSSSMDDMPGAWSVGNGGADLSRESTTSSHSSTWTSHSSASSDASSSNPVDYAPYLISDYQLQRMAQIRRSQRQKPKGPRQMDCNDPLQRATRPTLSIDTSTPPQPHAIALPLVEFPHIAPECTSPSLELKLPPPLLFSPSEDVIDWDVIYEALGC
ncbi:hypothetical protein BV22DRAFT_1027609 [Leucogyrophana mollusca]|uniref:Uncharacterized protein n=1 Tax=Leucogyrophana mollusca TaxID=85980 RepID=A0ACB8C0I1_9AGAM|nr:hypothetical protein BV22DRAFT_1027609 [Leucogyrophana mollusca]